MLKYVGDKIAVKEIKQTITESGLIIPDVAENPYIMRCEVVGFGEKATSDPELEDLEEGDVILAMRSGTVFEIQGDKYPLIRPVDIIAIEKGE